MQEQRLRHGADGLNVVLRVVDFEPLPLFASKLDMIGHVRLSEVAVPGVPQLLQSLLLLVLCVGAADLVAVLDAKQRYQIFCQLS